MGRSPLLNIMEPSCRFGDNWLPPACGGDPRRAFGAAGLGSETQLAAMRSGRASGETASTMWLVIACGPAEARIRRQRQIEPADAVQQGVSTKVGGRRPGCRGLHRRLDRPGSGRRAPASTVNRAFENESPTTIAAAGKIEIIAAREHAGAASRHETQVRAEDRAGPPRRRELAHARAPPRARRCQHRAVRSRGGQASATRRSSGPPPLIERGSPTAPTFATSWRNAAGLDN
jgi:hypothetical protein